MVLWYILIVFFLHCLTENDDCTPDSCNGRGDCTDLDAGYECVCYESFSGDACETGEYSFIFTGL